MTPIIVDLAETSLRLPAHPSLIRETIAAAPEPDHHDRYDYATLFYDCLWDPARQAVCLTAPPLLNFRALVAEADWALDGAPVSVSAVEQLARGEMLVLPAPGKRPQILTVRHPLFSGTVPVDRPVLDAFEGCNVLYAISKNNRLEWIRDWLRYHVQEQGANAVVLIDNGSTAYGIDELSAALAVPGINAAAILRADFPFGPSSSAQSKFLHMTMVHVIRQRFIGRARAGLNVDIDELVWSDGGISIFDATRASEAGYLRITGQWVHAKSGNRHSDHRFVSTLDGRVPRKYCVVPDGPQAERPWLTHRIISRRDPNASGFGFWHCRQVSTGWDYARDRVDPESLSLEPRLSETMTRVFAAQADDIRAAPATLTI